MCYASLVIVIVCHHYVFEERPFFQGDFPLVESVHVLHFHHFVQCRLDHFHVVLLARAPADPFSVFVLRPVQSSAQLVEDEHRELFPVQQLLLDRRVDRARDRRLQPGEEEVQVLRRVLVFRARAAARGVLGGAGRVGRGHKQQRPQLVAPVRHGRVCFRRVPPRLLPVLAPGFRVVQLGGGLLRANPRVAHHPAVRERDRVLCVYVVQALHGRVVPRVVRLEAPLRLDRLHVQLDELLREVVGLHALLELLAAAAGKELRVALHLVHVPVGDDGLLLGAVPVVDLGNLDAELALGAHPRGAPAGQPAVARDHKRDFGGFYLAALSRDRVFAALGHHLVREVLALHRVLHESEGS
mmetsp:Transcript_27638/g.69680  ORF Transcript_27638/g.69680 Transcript_27638/m.69680 type:complete len:355 (+) Transcript_27638:435-1499(+)